MVFQDDYDDDSKHIEATIDCVQKFEVSKIKIIWDVKGQQYIDKNSWHVENEYLLFINFSFLE